MRLIDADLVAEKIKAKCNSGQWAEAVVFGMEKALYLVKTAPTIIDCGEMNHEALGKIPYMDLRPRMTEEKLNEITSRVCDIFRHTEFYDCTFCDKGMGGDCIECEEEHTVYFLLDVIASLHNELYKQVKGKYYDYMFHWANLGYLGSPDDSMFKSGLEKARSNLMEHMRKSGQIMEEGENNDT